MRAKFDVGANPIFHLWELQAVCTENSIRVDLVTESPNVSDDGRTVMLLPRAVRLAIQVEVPT